MIIKLEDKYKEFLYKYRPLIGIDKSHINENTLKILRDGELYFSKPSQFNDPFDSKIDYNTNTTKTELRAYITKLLKKYGKPLSDIDNITEKINTGKIKSTDLVPKHPYPDSFKIFCLSKDEKNILMWSHYAKDHTGVCIGFKVHEGSNSMNIRVKPGYFIPIAGFDNNLLPVTYINYSKKKPKPYNHFIQNKHKLDELLTHFKTKSKLWEYEKEVRIILYDKTILKNPICLETCEIGEIIFGLRTPPELIDKVIQIVKNYPDNGSHVKLYKCVEVKGQYAIEKKEI